MRSTSVCAIVLVSVCAIVLVSVFAGVGAARAQSMTEADVLILNMRTPSPLTFHNKTRQIVWYYEQRRSGSTFLRLHFTDIVDARDKDYSVVVRDGRYQEIFKYSRSQFAGAGDFWTGIIPGGLAIVEIRASELPEGLNFVVKEMAYQVAAATVESYIGERPQWQDVVSVNDAGIARTARAVAKLSFMRPNGKGDSCSGFMIDDNRLVTNDHCVNTPALCKSTVALFGFERQANGSIAIGEQARCLEVIDRSDTYDVAILRLEGAPGRAERWGSLTLADKSVTKGDNLYVVQHPKGTEKVVIRTGCAVSTESAENLKRQAGADFGHRCDTAGGSSGAPVLDTLHRVVGLHHLGYDGKDKRWQRENRAVFVKYILQLFGKP